MRWLFAILLLVAMMQKSPRAEGSSSRPVEPSVCERDIGKDGLAAWMNTLVHTLCQRADADSLLAAYLITLPGFSSRGAADDGLLVKAHELARSNPKLLWVLTMRMSCVRAGCVADENHIADVASSLTHVDPGNAMAWFALAFAQDYALGKPDEVTNALNKAAQAPRVHDYGFDLTKLAVTASGEVPIPQSVLRTENGKAVSPEAIRWSIAQNVSLLSMQFTRWVSVGCNQRNPSPPGRIEACNTAKKQFAHGDSVLTLSENPEAKATMEALIRRQTGSWQDPFAKAMIDTIDGAANERDWFTKATAKLDGK